MADALRRGDARAVEGIELYAKIFHVDAASKRLGEDVAQRFVRRERESAPLVESLRAWVERMRAEVEPKSVLGKALGYLHRQWKRLTAFMRDPLMEMTNNEVERDLRSHAANYLLRSLGRSRRRLRESLAAKAPRASRRTRSTT